MNESKAKTFWNWFLKNSPRYRVLNQLGDNSKDQLLNEFLENLHDVNPNLYFQIGDDTGDECEVIISADGIKEYFKDAEELAARAPLIPGWKIIALKPPLGTDFITNYEGIIVDPRETWFMPLENQSKAIELGLRIYIKNFDSMRNENFLAACYQALDTILGEKSSGTDINYIEAEELKSTTDLSELIRLDAIREYVEWYKRKR